MTILLLQNFKHKMFFVLIYGRQLTFSSSKGGKEKEKNRVFYISKFSGAINYRKTNNVHILDLKCDNWMKGRFITLIESKYIRIIS